MFSPNIRSKFTPQRQADLERVYLTEYKRRVKAGESGPFAALMAARLQIQTVNELIEAESHG